MSDPCVKEDKINRLEADVVSINDRMNRHSDKIDKISDNNLVLETILKRLEDDSIIQKQNTQETNRTMLSIQTAMAEITFNVRELNSKLTSTESKMNDSCKKLEDVENRGKFDVIKFAISVGIPTLLMLGFATYVTNLVR